MYLSDMGCTIRFRIFLIRYYKVSRLPWNILEFTARHILRPEGAAFFLQFFSASLMSISVFLYFRRLISKSNALLLAVVSIFFPLFTAMGVQTITTLFPVRCISSRWQCRPAQSLNGHCCLRHGPELRPRSHYTPIRLLHY